ncbi:MAG TPA: glucose 1-dehydrogenase [Caulobacteraceae bacterium]|nr:glucose 1-dehydrogenase [Caulobacteraceae bacterium]
MSENTGRAEGKVALVTGAASGIGRGCALALAREGARVIVADVDTEGARETCRLIDAQGDHARTQALDVTDEAAWAEAVESVRGEGAGLHILVNNAALCIRARVLEMSLAAWRRQASVNLDGVFLGTRAALPLMADSGGGSIVNISSVAGLKGIAGLSGYCATKGGVRLFTKAVALECAQARNGVRVNSVHPGSIETPIWVKMANDGEMPKVGANAVAHIMEEIRTVAAEATPLGFSGAPEDIAEAVLYLCSPAARFVTGAELVVDGGVWAG